MHYLWPITAAIASLVIAYKSVLLRENPFSWKMVLFVAACFVVIESLLWYTYRSAPSYFRAAFLTEGVLIATVTLFALYRFKEIVNLQHWMGAAFVVVGVFFLIKG